MKQKLSWMAIAMVLPAWMAVKFVAVLLEAIGRVGQWINKRV
jgi:hypothetical protein